MTRLLLVALVAGCGGAAPAVEAPAAGLEACRPATFVCSVMAARNGETARSSIEVRTGGAATAEIAGAIGPCAVSLVSSAPEEHVLEVRCEGTAFTLREPRQAFETEGPWSVEARCWYAQEGHRDGCDTCRAIDYCEGPDVGGV